MEMNFSQHTLVEDFKLPFAYTDTNSSELTSRDEEFRYLNASKGRGRKRLRPGNPLKTEVLDKF